MATHKHCDHPATDAARRACRRGRLNEFYERWHALSVEEQEAQLDKARQRRTDPTPQHREARLQRMRDRSQNLSPEQRKAERQRRQQSNRKRMDDPEYRKAANQRRREKLDDPELRAKKNANLRENRRKRKADPEWLAKNAIRDADPERRERRAITRRKKVNKRYHTDPEFRVDVIARVKKRKALKRGAHGADLIIAEDIYERDGWVCQLCFEEVDPLTFWPHPESPSLDHIIPLSLGGSHTEDNVHLAHLFCNLSKGNRYEVAL